MVHWLSSELQGRATAATFIEPRAAGSSSTKELERHCKSLGIVHGQRWFFEERPNSLRSISISGLSV
jgi:hypothetical protein